MEQQPELTFVALTADMLASCTAIAADAPDPWSLQNLETAMNDLNRWVFVALSKEQPVGFACFLTVAGSADLEMLAVHTQHRSKTIATQLLAHSFEELKSQNVAHCLLEVRASNQPALSLYRKLGFKVLAKRENLYSKPREDGFLMALAL